MQVLIVEDEQQASDKLIKLIAEYDPTIEVLGQIDAVEEAVEWFQQHPPPDLIFLDIQLADGSSFEIFEQVEIHSPIIFTTAYDQYAIQAFKTRSIDYLLKPIRQEDLRHAMEKYQDIFGSQQQSTAPSLNLAISELADLLQEHGKTYKSRFLVKMGNTIKSIATTDIAYFQTEDRTTLLITKDNHRYPVNYTLEDLEPLLDPAQFARANRQFLIHIEAIHKIHPWFKSRLKLELQPAASADLVISVERTKAIKTWLGGE